MKNLLNTLSVELQEKLKDFNVISVYIECEEVNVRSEYDLDPSFIEAIEKELTAKKYVIEQLKLDITIRTEERKYVGMFKYKGSHWCYFLPLKTMYLSTLKEVVKSIERSKLDSTNYGWEAEYKIAEIIN